MPDTAGVPFWHHAAAATAFRVLLAAAGLDTYLESRIEVGTPVTAAIRYREAAQLARLGLSPYAGAAFHGPPLLLAGAQLADSLLGRVIPGFSVLAAPWRVLATSAADVAAAAALARLAAAVAPKDGRPGAVAPATLAALYLWSPPAVAASVGGSPAGLENAAVFGALAAAASGNAAAAGFALAAATYLGLHPVLLTAAAALLLWRGPEPLHVQPALQPADSKTLQPTANGPAVADAAARAATPKKAQDQHDADQAAGRSHIECVTQKPGAAFGCPVEGGSGFGSPLELQPPDAEAAAAAPGSDAARRSESVPTLQLDAAQLTASEGESRAAAAVASSEAAAEFRRDFKRRRRPGGARSAAAFLAWLALGCGALALLSDFALRRFPEHRCGGLPRWPPVLGGKSQPGCAATAAELGAARGRHWAAETYGFVLTVADLTPNIGLHWYFFSEMFAHFRPFWHFVFHAAAAALVVPLALRMPHRPLAAALLQCITNALLKPYPSVGDVAQYLVLLPLFAPQLAGGGFPVKFLAATFALLAGLGPAMWHMWIYLGSANANFYYAITLLFGAWQALLAVAVVRATLRFDRLLAGKSLERC